MKTCHQPRKTLTSRRAAISLPLLMTWGAALRAHAGPANPRSVAGPDEFTEMEQVMLPRMRLKIAGLTATQSAAGAQAVTDAIEIEIENVEAIVMDSDGTKRRLIEALREELDALDAELN